MKKLILIIIALYHAHTFSMQASSCMNPSPARRKIERVTSGILTLAGLAISCSSFRSECYAIATRYGASCLATSITGPVLLCGGALGLIISLRNRQQAAQSAV